MNRDFSRLANLTHMAPAWAALLISTLTLAACATAPRSNKIAIETASGGATVSGANCSVGNGAVGWQIQSPAVVEIAIGDGDLQVVCEKPGYRSSQVVFQSGGYGYPGGYSGSSVSLGLGASSGGWHRSGFGMGLGVTQAIGGGGAVGNYPSRIVVEMTPLP